MSLLLCGVAIGFLFATLLRASVPWALQTASLWWVRRYAGSEAEQATVEGFLRGFIFACPPSRLETNIVVFLLWGKPQALHPEAEPWVRIQAAPYLRARLRPEVRAWVDAYPKALSTGKPLE